MIDIPRKGSLSDERWLAWNYAIQAAGKRISLKINGEEVKRPVAYDLDKGWVEGHATEPGTNLVSIHNGRIDFYRLEGKIEAEIVARK